MSYPVISTPTTAPCTPDASPLSSLDVVEPIVVTSPCDCGCLPICYCREHNKERSKNKKDIRDSRELFQNSNNKYGYIIGSMDELPSWFFKVVEHCKFQKADYEQRYVLNLSWKKLSPFFDYSDWNGHYSLFNNNESELLSVLPTRIRVYPQCCGNGAILTLLASWSKVLARIVRGAINGEYDVIEELEDDSLCMRQEMFTYEWDWKVYMGFRNFPHISVEGADERKKVPNLMIESTSCASYVLYSCTSSYFGSENWVPFTDSAGYAAFANCRYARDYQEMLFESLVGDIKRSRCALNSVGFDYITREDLYVENIFEFRIF